MSYSLQLTKKMNAQEKDKQAEGVQGRDIMETPRTSSIQLS